MKYLTLEQAANYLNVTEDTVKRYVDCGELPVYKLKRAVRFKREDIDELVIKQFEVLLTPGLRAAISHSCPIKEGADSWRILVVFYDTRGRERKLIPFGSRVKETEYRVFVTGEYLEDQERLPNNIYGAEKFALRFIKKRFEETRDKKGERDINRITEGEVFCIHGKCSTKPDPHFFS